MLGFPVLTRGKMMRLIGAALIFMCALLGTAHAQSPSDANLLQDWVCPSGTCPTQCNGPAGTLTINAHDVKVFQFVLHPRRLWLFADGQVYVLGDDDRCHFGGATSSPIKFVSPPAPPIESSPLGNPPGAPPPCICIPGHPCQPLGCVPGH